MLRGDATLTKAEVTMKTMISDWETEDEGFLVEFKGMTTETEGGEQFDPVKAQEKPTHPVINRLVREYELIFESLTQLPPKRNIDHQIILKEGQNPINVRPYKYSHSQKDEIKKLIKEMLTVGFIHPSKSPFSSPVPLVKKKDGGWRFCVDYRKVNQATIADKFPIPVIEELLDELHGSTYFSKLDLRSGYHQIRMKEEDIPKTAFQTHEAHYEFIAMPCGLTNAPTTFQSLMNQVFRPFLRRFVLVFFDGILVYNPNLDTHEKHLTMVFNVLSDHKLYANQKKCAFEQSQIHYLGHWVSCQGVQADGSKIQAMVE